MAMRTDTLPPIKSVPDLPTEARAVVLDKLFEPCTALHTLSVEALRENKFESYDDLISFIGKQLTALSESQSTSDDAWLVKILGAHPRLGQKSESSTSNSEQKQLGGEGVEELRNLNAEYEKTFPGTRLLSTRTQTDPCRIDICVRWDGCGLKANLAVSL